MVSEKDYDILVDLYENPKNPGSLGGVERLYKSTDGRYSRKQLREFLKTRDAYTLHRYKFKPKSYARITAEAIDSLWSLDLADMQNIASLNDKYRYLLFCVDTVSRYLFVKPLLNKTPQTTGDAFADIITDTGRKPGKILTDAGKEFTGKEFQKILDVFHIEHVITGSDKKSTIAERCIRTIKERLYRLFTVQDTKQYISHLDKIVDSYNKSFHRSIGRSPASVKPSNQKLVIKYLSKKELSTTSKATLLRGSLVRISKLKTKVEKGYTPKWTKELFKIDRVLMKTGAGPMYKLIDLKGETVKGAFYPNEVQLSYQTQPKKHRRQVQNTTDKAQENIFPVEKIVKTINNKKGEAIRYLVKWKGYSNRFNSYINANDLII